MINIGGYTFKSKLIDSALTHSSFSSDNYERLEFLGDSILDFLIADILFNSENFKEDELTRARANIVNEENLSKVFDNLSLHEKVKIGKSCPYITRAIKCDVVESIIATIYLESGIDTCKTFIKNNFNLKPNERKDYKSLFQEYAQKMKLNFYYEMEKTEGPPHDLIFYINLKVDNKILTSAFAKSKSEAEKKCAEIALKIYKQ